MDKNTEVKVVALRNTAISIPTARHIRLGEVFTVPKWAADKLEEIGDVRMYGRAGAEDKAIRPYVANKDAIVLAKKHGVDLSVIEGTGKGDRITKTDVKTFMKAQGIK